MISFAAIAPHPPILLPAVGSEEDREKVGKTLGALDKLNQDFQASKPDQITISSPHPDWGFNVPLYFLASDFSGEIERVLTGVETPQEHFQKGKELSSNLEKEKRYALIASGDLSHCLKDKGPYDFHPDGPKFDEALIENLKEKNIKNILTLDNQFPEAGECGLRSFSFLLGLLEGQEAEWNPEILSYEGPFGVGYLVAKLI